MAEAKAAPKHADIADKLTQEILLGQYRAGERLPSERDLSGRFDANRGAVREAMQRLTQLGIVDIQPGGARVSPIDEANLDIIGHLLTLGSVPDAALVSQVMQVVTSLITLAAETAVNHASDADLARIARLVEPLSNAELTGFDHTQARLTLIQAIMEVSGNLPCQLISRSLLVQMAPRLAVIEPFLQTDYAAYAQVVKQLSPALSSRNVEAVRKSFADMAQLNLVTVQRALNAAEQHFQQDFQQSGATNAPANQS